MGAKKGPVVPPVYRPFGQTTLQAKLSGNGARPAAPAAFRSVPRTTPVVIQRAGISTKSKDVDFGDVDDYYGHHGRGRSSSSGSEGEGPGGNRRAPLAPVSFKIIHKHLGSIETTGDSNSLSVADFGKQGRRVVSCILKGPADGRTHYEVLCQISGLYGMTKYVVFHITAAGYFAIYNARPNDPGFAVLNTAPPKATMNTTEKLYAEFMKMAREKGSYKSGIGRGGKYTCENFAREFFESITGIDTEDSMF